MTTRLGFVAKNMRFLTKNGDENKTRRQKYEVFDQKCRRDWVSSPKI
ncbi:hypothetical protein [Caldibacillus thermoamylovorans]|nr:hypothetical protein [Caldibacillus thermoamylovorans]